MARSRSSSTYGALDDVAAASPRVLTFDAANNVAEALSYRVFRNERGEPDMAIESHGAIASAGRIAGQGA